MRVSRSLLEHEGYAAARFFLQMEMALGEELEAPIVPDGITFRACDDPDDQRRMYETIEEAMVDHWGHVRRSFDGWMDRRRGSTFDPSLWWLAMDGDEPAAGRRVLRFRSHHHSFVKTISFLASAKNSNIQAQSGLASAWMTGEIASRIAG